MNHGSVWSGPWEPLSCRSTERSESLDRWRWCKSIFWQNPLKNIDIWYNTRYHRKKSDTRLMGLVLLEYKYNKACVLCVGVLLIFPCCLKFMLKLLVNIPNFIIFVLLQGQTTHYHMWQSTAFPFLGSWNIQTCHNRWLMLTRRER